MIVFIQFPKAAAAPQPFRLRVVQCWIKSPMVGYQQTQTAGTSGMNDGLIHNFNALTDITFHAAHVIRI